MNQKTNKVTNDEKINIFSGGSIDFTLVLIVVFLITFGVIMIYSSSYYASFVDYNNHVGYFKKQLIWCLIGLVVMFVVASFDYRFICKFHLLFYMVANGLLVLVLFTAPINGAKRWIDLGFISFQPSEIAKLTIIIIMAVSITSTRKYLDQFRVFIINVLIILVPVALIGIENKSTSFVALVIGLSMLFVAMPNKKSLFRYLVLPAIGLGAAGIILIISMLTQLKEVIPAYVVSRIESFIEGPFADPTGKGYQSVQSLYAIGSGGFFGKGLGNSMQKNGFIPEAHNDIIFSIICEELGLFGAIAVLLLFVLLLWRCVVIAVRAKDLLGMLIVTGVMTQIAIQVIINIAVVTNSMPVTGMPLPFISYGGTSLLFLLVELGIVLSISKDAC